MEGVGSDELHQSGAGEESNGRMRAVKQLSDDLQRNVGHRDERDQGDEECKVVESRPQASEVGPEADS